MVVVEATAAAVAVVVGGTKRSSVAVQNENIGSAMGLEKKEILKQVASSRVPSADVV